MLVNSIFEGCSLSENTSNAQKTYQEVKEQLNVLGMDLVHPLENSLKSWKAKDGRWYTQYSAPEMTTKQFHLLQNFQLNMGDK